MSEKNDSHTIEETWAPSGDRESDSRLIQSLVGREMNGKYKVMQKIGSGGMGAIYRARQFSLDRDVALKILWVRDDSSAEKRFYREASLAAKLKHPNTIRIYDFGVSNMGMLFIVMELLQGKSLREMIKLDGPLPVEDVEHIAVQILDALSEAHKEGMIHRDIKPSNIFLTFPSGQRPFARLIDFGLVKEVNFNPEASATGTIGTPLYMAPEQLKNSEADIRSDLYSLGLTLFSALSGKKPFEAPDLPRLIQSQLKEKPVWGDVRVPGHLRRIVNKAISKNPAERFKTAEEMKSALLKIEETGSPESLQKNPSRELRFELEEDSEDFPPENPVKSEHSSNAAGEQLSSNELNPSFSEAELSSFTIPLSNIGKELSKPPSPLPQRVHLERMMHLGLMPFSWLQRRALDLEPPRSPEDTAHGVVTGATPALRVVFIGATEATCVGLESHKDGVCAQFSQLLNKRTSRAVSWENHGFSKAKISDLGDSVLSQIPKGRVDIIVVLPGITDMYGKTTLPNWRRSVNGLISGLKGAFGEVAIVFLGPGPLPGNLPWPCSSVLQKKRLRMNWELERLFYNSSELSLVSFGGWPKDRLFLNRREHSALAEQIFSQLDRVGWI